MVRRRSSVLAFISVATLHGYPALAGEPTAATPLGNPGEWASSNDYPAQALRERTEGITRFTLSIGSDGKVASCTVTVSSGSDLLDRKTCEVITLRALFKPATDKKGKAVEGAWSNSVRWQIPGGPEQMPQPYLVSYSVLIGVDGQAADCRIERLEGSAATEGKRVGSAPYCRFPSSVTPFKDAKGNPVAKRVRMTQQMEILDEPSTTVSPLPKQ